MSNMEHEHAKASIGLHLVSTCFPPDTIQVPFVMSIIHRSRASKEIDGYSLSPSTQLSFTDPAIVSTLPFNPCYVRRDRTEEVLQRTLNRWIWFDEALKSDPTLGTLRYLPLEIRQRIWEMVIQDDDTLSADGPWDTNF